VTYWGVVGVNGVLAQFQVVSKRHATKHKTGQKIAPLLPHEMRLTGFALRTSRFAFFRFLLATSS
jgi:hypothetical protein